MILCDVLGAVLLASMPDPSTVMVVLCYFALFVFK